MIKDNDFLSENVDEIFKTRFEQVAAATSSIFTHLVKLSALNPKIDFRHANLDGVDFAGSDLRGFDFTGSSLRESVWREATWDHTTILDEADLTGADIEPEVLVRDHVLEEPEEVRRKYWPEVVMWMDNLQPTGRDEVVIEKLLAVLLTTRDTFVRRTALKTLARFIDFAGITRILTEVVFARNDQGLITTAFDLLSLYTSTNRPEVIRYVAPFLATRHVAEAGSFLARHVESGRPLKMLIEYMSRVESRVARLSFVSAFAFRNGEVASVMSRNAWTQDPFDFNEKIEPKDIARIAFTLGKRAGDADALRLSNTNFKVFLELSLEEIEMRVLKFMRSTAALGFNWKVPNHSTMFSYQIKRRSNIHVEGTSWLE